MSEAAPLAEATRRDRRSGDAVVESRHHGHLVVVGPDGSVVVAHGDPERQTFLRSAVKPFQATVCLETAGDAADDLTLAEVAVGWASHRGEPRHLEAVQRILDRLDLSGEALTTPPTSPEAQPALAPARINYNCSGKHALFALAGRALGLSGQELLDPDGPLQKRILAELEDVVGELTAVATDGCGAPAVRASLLGLARSFRTLWTDDRYRRVREAGLAHPGLVGGEGRLESALMVAGLLAKVGAEGVYGVSWRDDAGAVWGLAAKTEDGNERGAAAAIRDLLVEAGVIAADVWDQPVVRGGGAPQGVVRASAEVLALAPRLG